MDIEDKTLKALGTSLQFRQMRQDLLSSNIANAETPGYKTKRLDFEDALSRALDVDGQQTLNTADEEHFNVGGGGFSNLEPEIYDDPNGNVTESGNNVNVDEELALMAENKILYDATVQLLNKKLAMKKYILGNEN